MTEPWQDEFLLRTVPIASMTRMAFYAVASARENERARREALWISAVCLVLAALFGTLATADEDRRETWAVFVAGFGALATAVGAFEAAFGFERLSRQYEDTRGAWTSADLDGPQTTADGGAVDSKDLLEFVERMEGILRSEVDTWSQVTAMPGRGDGAGGRCPEITAPPAQGRDVTSAAATAAAIAGLLTALLASSATSTTRRTKIAWPRWARRLPALSKA